MAVRSSGGASDNGISGSTPRRPSMVVWGGSAPVASPPGIRASPSVTRARMANGDAGGTTGVYAPSSSNLMQEGNRPRR